MIKALKLNSAILILIVGLLIFVIAEMIQENSPLAYKWLLGVSGVACLSAAILFLLPFFRAKKVDPDGKVVNLTPLGESPEEALEKSLKNESEPQIIENSEKAG
ncbi:MAG: hypothetical protein EOO99_04035 [Pedobacter sp.]|nr:MAG: hypothetical protein EOO99_04035 [Pedobacter sp.]